MSHSKILAVSLAVLLGLSACSLARPAAQPSDHGRTADTAVSASPTPTPPAVKEFHPPKKFTLAQDKRGDGLTSLGSGAVFRGTHQYGFSGRALLQKIDMSANREVWRTPLLDAIPEPNGTPGAVRVNPNDEVKGPLRLSQDGKVLYATFAARTPAAGSGRDTLNVHVFALDAASGKVRWKNAFLVHTFDDSKPDVPLPDVQLGAAPGKLWVQLKWLSQRRGEEDNSWRTWRLMPLHTYVIDPADGKTLWERKGEALVGEKLAYGLENTGKQMRAVQLNPDTGAELGTSVPLPDLRGDENSTLTSEINGTIVVDQGGAMTEYNTHVLDGGPQARKVALLRCRPAPAVKTIGVCADGEKIPGQKLTMVDWTTLSPVWAMPDGNHGEASSYVVFEDALYATVNGRGAVIDLKTGKDLEPDPGVADVVGVTSNGAIYKKAEGLNAGSPYHWARAIG